MVLDAVSNFVRGTADAEVGTDDTTVSVDDASIFPDPETDGEFNVVIWDADNFPRPDQDADVEILRVTARDTDANELTVTRAQEMTSAAEHAEGSAIHLSPTAKMFSDIESTFGDFWDAGTQELTADVNNTNTRAETLEADEINNVEHISPDEDLVSVLDSVGASTKLLLEPDATYQIDGEISVRENNIVIEGGGMDSTTIEFSEETGDNMFLVGGESSANYFNIQNLTLDCSNQTEPSDFGVGDGDNDKSPGNAMLFDNENGVGVTGSTVENVRIENAANEAIAYFGSSVFATEFFATVRNCEIINPRFRGIHPHFDHTVAAINNTFRDCTETYDALIRHSHIIVNNRFENCRAGLDSDNTAACIVGSDFASVISANTFEKCGNADENDVLGEVGIVSWEQDRDYITDNSFVECDFGACLSTHLLDRGDDRGGSARFVNNIVIENDGGGIFADKKNTVVQENWLEDVTFNWSGGGFGSRQRLIWVGGGVDGVQIDTNWIVGGSGNEAAISVLDPGENYIENNYFDTAGFLEFVDAPDGCVVRDNDLLGGDNSRNGVLGWSGDDTNQEIPDGTWTKVEWNTVESEDELVVNVDESQNEITVKNSGSYSITAFLRFASDSGWSTGDRIFVGVSVNGGDPDRRFNATKAGESTQGISLPSTELDLDAGDVLDIRVFQESGSEKEVDRSSDPFWQQFSVRQLA